MSFLLYKLKRKSVEQNTVQLALPTLSETKTYDQDTSEIEKLQDQIGFDQGTLDLFMNHVLITLDANIDDLKNLINQKRFEEKTYKLSVCDLWLRIKAIENMEPMPLVKFLRTYELRRTEIKFHSDTDDDKNKIMPPFLINPRRSRFTHFHICSDSDEFNVNISSYVGLVLLSYGNQSTFVLNDRHCQRGDIIIKATKNFSTTESTHRGIYDALIKWYFGRSMDQNFFGIGFICSNDSWRFDLLSLSRREVLLYEYRVLDMFMLTHWLNQSPAERDVLELEVNAEHILWNQYDTVKKILYSQDNNVLLNNWKESIGSDEKDLELAIKLLNHTMENDITSYFNYFDFPTNIESLE